MLHFRRFSRSIPFVVLLAGSTTAILFGGCGKPTVVQSSLGGDGGDDSSFNVGVGVGHVGSSTSTVVPLQGFCDKWSGECPGDVSTTFSNAECKTLCETNGELTLPDCWHAACEVSIGKCATATDPQIVACAVANGWVANPTTGSSSGFGGATQAGSTGSLQQSSSTDLVSSTAFNASSSTGTPQTVSSGSGSADAGSSCDNQNGGCASLSSPCVACADSSTCKSQMDACNANSACATYQQCTANCGAADGGVTCVSNCGKSGDPGYDLAIAWLSCVICEVCPNDCNAATNCATLP
jgi:hypothetical protein